jgi:hypothetical protein
MFKKALEIVEPTGPVGKSTALLANTLGRASSLPIALLVGQEKAHDYLKNYSKEDLEKEIEHLKDDPRLRNTLIRLNHSDPVDSIKRLWKSDNHPLIKGVGSITAFPYALATSKTRMNHYNPLTDTVELYSRVPEIAHHELGHARDINNAPVRTAAGMMVQNMLMPSIAGGPFTQYLESKANEEAEKGYRGDMREFRRRLWPARGTYWGALAGGLALLNPDVRNAVGSFVNSGMPENPELADHAASYLKAMAVGLTPVAAGALGGRALAETRNLFDNSPQKNMNTKQAHINGFVKRASEYGLNHNEAMQIYKEAFVGDSAYADVPEIDEDALKNMSFKAMKDYVEPKKGKGLLSHLKRHPGAYTGLALGSLLGSGLSGAAGGDELTQLLSGAVAGGGGALLGSVPDMALNSVRKAYSRNEAERYLHQLSRHAHTMRNLNSDAQSFYHNSPE